MDPTPRRSHSLTVRSRVLLALALGTLVPMARARAQGAHPGDAPVTTTVGDAPLSPRDSLRILDDARKAQWRFEVTRRQNLPRTAPSDVPTCEITVGRMCYWSEPEHEEPIPEPRSITIARDRLTVTLGRLAERSRADPWIAGQRVRYLSEGMHDSAAVVAARECWASKWWCGVLLGFALHEGGRYADAEAAFDTALAAMPPDVRCRWSDISLLLDDGERDAYLKLPCDRRGEIERRFWALAQPSYAVRGNDRRTEHFSRVLLAELQATSANAYGMPWGDDLRELLIRYGQPLWYAAAWPDAIGRASSPTGHDRDPSYHFAAVRDRGDSVHWDVRAKGARERYAPPYIDSLTDLDAQFAMLKRGDSAIVVAVYADSGAHDAVLGVSADAPVAHVAGDSTVTIRVRRARTAWRGVVAGVEHYDAAHRRDARARIWLAPPAAPAGAPALSTLLLFAGDTSATVSSLDDALSRALTANELPANQRLLGLYWEVYGTSPGSATPRSDSATRDSAHAATPADSALPDSAVAELPVDGDSVTSAHADSAVARDTIADSARARSAPDSVRTDTVRLGVATAHDTTGTGSDLSISVARIDGNVLTRLGEALHIVRRDSPLALRWHDAQLGDGVAARSVVLDLAQLPPGKYRITLAAGPDDRHRTLTSREIRLR